MGMMAKTIEPVPARAAAYCALYPMLQQIAKDHGYALAVHGSVHRDFDLIAVPWVETCADPKQLISSFKAATKMVVHSDQIEDEEKAWPDLSVSEKPHGRQAYSLHVTNHGMYAGYLDISIIPPVKK
jgi:hypothetical protein